MSLARSIGRNTILQVIGKGIGTVLGLLTVAILQRSLGTENYGAYTTIMSYMGFFSVIADLGLYLVVVREISKPGADEEKIVGNAMTIRLISAGSILLLGIALSFLFPYGADVRVGIAIISVSFFFIAFQQLLVGIFQKAMAMIPVVVGEVVGRIVLLGLVIWIARTPNLPLLLLAVVAGSVVNAIIVILAAHKRVRLRLRYDKEIMRMMLHAAWPIAISITLNLLYFRLDTIFLSVFHSFEEVGLYGAAYKILEVLVTLPNLFVGLMMPILSATAYVDPERFKAVFHKSFELLLIAAVPLVVGGFVLAEPLMVLIGGQEFAGAAVFFRILLFSIAFLFLGALSGHAVTAIGKQKQMVWSYAAVAVLGIVLYVGLIPTFKGVGAAIGNVITEASIMVAGYIMIYRTLKVGPAIARVGKIVIASALMGVVVYVTQGLMVAIPLVLGAGMYVVALLGLRVIHVSTIKNILTKPSEPL